MPKRREMPEIYRHREVYKNSQSVKSANVTIPAKGQAYLWRVLLRICRTISPTFCAVIETFLLE